MAVAMTWVAKIFAAAVVMVAPAAAGARLAARFGRRVLSPLGVALGLVAGMAYLIAVTRNGSSSNAEDRDAEGQATGGRRSKPTTPQDPPSTT